MKKLLASLLCVALVIALAPLSLAQQTNTGQISGTATIGGKPAVNATVRVRNVDNGTIAATGKTNAQGQYSFTGLPAGNYVGEIVSDDGSLLGTSTRVALVAGAMAATGVGVSASAAAIGAAGAAVGGSFFTSTAGIITMAAIGTGIVAGAVIAADDDASPSQ